MFSCGNSHTFPTHNIESKNTQTFAFMSLINSSSFTRDSFSHMKVLPAHSGTPEISKFCSRNIFWITSKKFCTIGFLSVFLTEVIFVARTAAFIDEVMNITEQSECLSMLSISSPWRRFSIARNLVLTLSLNKVDPAERILFSSDVSKSMSVTDIWLNNFPIIALAFFICSSSTLRAAPYLPPNLHLFPTLENFLGFDSWFAATGCPVLALDSLRDIQVRNSLNWRMPSRMALLRTLHGFKMPNVSLVSIWRRPYLHNHLLAASSPRSGSSFESWKGVDTESGSIHHVWSFGPNVCELISGLDIPDWDLEVEINFLMIILISKSLSSKMHGSFMRKIRVSTRTKSTFDNSTCLWETCMWHCEFIRFSDDLRCDKTLRPFLNFCFRFESEWKTSINNQILEIMCGNTVHPRHCNQRKSFGFCWTVWHTCLFLAHPTESKCGFQIFKVNQLKSFSIFNNTAKSESHKASPIGISHMTKLFVFAFEMKCMKSNALNNLLTDHRTSNLTIRATYRHFKTMWEHTNDNSPTDSSFSSLHG